MPTSTNATLDYNRDALIRMAFQLAGLLGEGKDPSPADISMAADMMNLELMALQAEGVILRTVERTTLPLVAGTGSYTLPSDTMDIAIGPNDEAGTIIQPAGGSELPVSLMSRTAYLTLSDKTVTGRPSSVYIERQATVTLVFWPIPDSSTLQFRYGRVRLLKDMDTGGVTVDLGRRWLKFVAFATAANVARAKSLPTADTVQPLMMEAERLKAICKADDNSRGKMRFHVSHSGRRWG